jgi:hypothetical protein
LIVVRYTLLEPSRCVCSTNELNSFPALVITVTPERMFVKQCGYLIDLSSIVSRNKGYQRRYFLRLLSIEAKRFILLNY